MKLLSNLFAGMSDLIGLTNHYLIVVLSFPGEVLEQLMFDISVYLDPEDHDDPT